MSKSKGRKRKATHRLPAIGLVRHRPLLTPEAWEELGRPEWIIQTPEQYSVHRLGNLYYRTRVPACKKLEELVRFSDYAIKCYVGVLVRGGPPLLEVVPSPVSIVPPEAADTKKMMFASDAQVLLWDRILNDGNCQFFTHQKEG